MYAYSRLDTQCLAILMNTDLKNIIVQIIKKY